jgi:hypothetical protein
MKKNNLKNQNNIISDEQKIINRIMKRESEVKDLKTGKLLYKNKINIPIVPIYENYTISENEKLKKEKLKELFNKLDSDNDGYISLKNIKLSSINNQILSALTPVLAKLQKDNNRKMNFNEFFLRCDQNLYEILLDSNN